MKPLTAFAYPGAKSKMLDTLAPFIPSHFDEYREPFAGGLSMGLSLMRQYPERKYWVNDLDKGVYNFWSQLKEHPQKIVKRLNYLICKYNPVDLWCWSQLQPKDDIDFAGKWWIKQKTAFSGLATSTPSAYNLLTKVSPSAIQNLMNVAEVLNRANVLITNVDYSHLLANKGSNVFVYADPPYMLDRFLYPNHHLFDHQKFSILIKGCSHKWVLSYNDRPILRHWFADFNIHTIGVDYCANVIRRATELVITNF